MIVRGESGEVLSKDHKTFVMPSDGYLINENDYMKFVPFEVTAEQEIAQIQEYLRSTDYIGSRIAEGSKTVQDYQGLIDKRESTRERMRELEKRSKNRRVVPGTT